MGDNNEVRQELADQILRRIAERYKNCSVNIYHDLPELTPVEAVLRCAQEEGFTLRQNVPHASGAAPQPLPSVATKVRDSLWEAAKRDSDYGWLGNLGDELNAALAAPATGKRDELMQALIQWQIDERSGFDILASASLDRVRAALAAAEAPVKETK
jgi:hypothetical protein